MVRASHPSSAWFRKARPSPLPPKGCLADVEADELTGAYPQSSSFDTIEPLAHSVACCASADAIMPGDWDGAVPDREVQGLRLAVLRDFVLDGLAPAVEQAFGRALALLADEGARFSDLAFPELRDIPAINAKGGIVAGEALAVHRRLMSTRGRTMTLACAAASSPPRASPPPIIWTTSPAAAR